MALLGGQLLDIDVTIGEQDQAQSQPFGFTGSVVGAVIETATDRHPLNEREVD